MIRLSIRRGGTLDASALDELYALRGRFMRLKPDVAAQIDRRKFDDFMRSASHVLSGHDETGMLRMMVAVDRAEITTAGRTSIVHLGEYAFQDLEYRGHPGLLLQYFRVAARDLLSGTPVYAAGLGYPPSVLAGARHLGPPILPGAANDPVEAACFAHLAARVAGSEFDTASGRTAMRTLPPAPPAWWWGMARCDPNYTEFITRCPDWQSGYGLPVMFRLDSSTLARVASGVVRRVVTQFGRRSATPLRRARAAVMGDPR